MNRTILVAAATLLSSSAASAAPFHCPDQVRGDPVVRNCDPNRESYARQSAEPAAPTDNDGPGIGPTVNDPPAGPLSPGPITNPPEDFTPPVAVTDPPDDDDDDDGVVTPPDDDDDDDDGGTPPDDGGGNPGLGNPGNDKNVGKAGENPNGKGFGPTGSRGKRH